MKRTRLLMGAIALALFACLPAAFAAEAPPAGAPPAGATANTPAPSPTPTNTPAPTPAPPAAPVKTVRARVLKDCQHGKVDDIVSLPIDVAKAEEKAGSVDTHKDAVAYAATLPQNKPKPAES